MPLNLKDAEESEQGSSTKMGPPVHKPKIDMSGGVKAVVAIVVVAVIAVGVFMMYKSGMFGAKKQPATQEVFIQPVDTSAMIASAESLAAAQPAETVLTEAVSPPKSEKSMAAKAQKSKPKPKPKHENMPEMKRETKPETSPETNVSVRSAGTGNYTIYIGSYSSKTTADEEVGRWNEAGYHAFVNEFNSKKGITYRVCLGRYSTKDEARGKAEKLKDAFEGGYWVDVVK